MDLNDYFRFVLALVFVLSLIGLLSWAARRYGLGGRIAASSGTTRRIRIVEVTPLDAKRRFVLIRRDQTEHLVLIGGPSDVVIESGLPADGAETTSIPIVTSGAMAENRS